MNQVIDNIKQRRSIRRYTEKQVPRDIINECINSAIYAPSSHNRQPWDFTIITNKKLINELSDSIRAWYKSIAQLSLPLSFIKEVRKSAEEMMKRVKSEKDLFFYQAPCIVITHAPNKRFFAQDCSCAAQNLMLAARSLEVGSCWIGFADIVFNKNNNIKKKLNIPNSHSIMATIALGYPEKFPESALPRREPKKVWIE
ncbi:MAG: nitroreductase family protein [Nanoarchaeota archaeon]|nr:nitroreductase family protein [Nanoarchaeota archaeon]MBU1005926.1 nitroreductase family protein [Nanoarchaeota archaeon]MBU1946292.1 nitroreductase family protein [Nanoarchaeota archaeon]